MAKIAEDRQLEDGLGHRAFHLDEVCFGELEIQTSVFSVDCARLELEPHRLEFFTTHELLRRDEGVAVDFFALARPALIAEITPAIAHVREAWLHRDGQGPDHV